MLYDFRLQYDASLIPELAAKYLRTPYKDRTAADEDRLMEEAGKRLANGPFSLADVETTVVWKSHRPLGRFRRNTAEEGEAAIRQAIEATEGGYARRAVKALTMLDGVAVKMASAILTAMFPTLYTICDFRASHALGVKDYSSPRYYVAYLAACRGMAARYGASLRDFDRANWQWSKDKTKKKTKKCEARCWANDGESALRNASL